MIQGREKREGAGALEFPAIERGHQKILPQNMNEATPLAHSLARASCANVSKCYHGVGRSVKGVRRGERERCSLEIETEKLPLAAEK